MTNQDERKRKINLIGLNISRWYTGETSGKGVLQIPASVREEFETLISLRILPFGI